MSSRKVFCEMRKEILIGVDTIEAETQKENLAEPGKWAVYIHSYLANFIQRYCPTYSDKYLVNSKHIFK